MFDLVWTRAQRQRTHANADLRRRLPPERGRAVDVQLRAVERAEAVRAVRVLRKRSEAPARSEAAAARLRDDPQGRAHVQPARRARRDLGDRARRRTSAASARSRGSSRRRTSIRARRSAFRCCPTNASASRKSGRARCVATATLLVELVTEELPPKALKRARARRSPTRIVAGLCGARISRRETRRRRRIATPRRLAVAITDVAARRRTKPFEQKLMPVEVAFDADGKPPPKRWQEARRTGRARHLATTTRSRTMARSSRTCHRRQGRLRLPAEPREGPAARRRACRKRSTRRSRSCRSPRS